jgi:hypothetical protein
MWPVAAWVLTALLAACCTFTHGPVLALKLGCTAVLAAGAVWVTFHR